MTPKEKAKILIDEYYLAIGDVYDVYLNINSYSLQMKKAKQCALIAVNEIINANPHSNPFNTDIYSTMSFWQEVKAEIEKM